MQPFIYRNRANTQSEMVLKLRRHRFFNLHVFGKSAGLTCLKKMIEFRKGLRGEVLVLTCFKSADYLESADPVALNPA